MYTVIEVDDFQREANILLTHLERLALISFLAENPTAGDVVPGSGGCRKLRWAISGTGKRGGARVIYFNQLTQGYIFLIAIYAKSVTSDIPAHLLRAIKKTSDEI